MVVMTTIFKIEFLGGEFLLVRAVLSIRLHAKRAVLGIIIVVVKKINEIKLARSEGSCWVLCLCPNLERKHQVLKDVNDLKI